MHHISARHQPRASGGSAQGLRKTQHGSKPGSKPGALELKCGDFAILQSEKPLEITYSKEQPQKTTLHPRVARRPASSRNCTLRRYPYESVEVPRPWASSRAAFFSQRDGVFSASFLCLISSSRAIFFSRQNRNHTIGGSFLAQKTILNYLISI